ncbi:MAG: glycoside hydrolase family 3 N-terminal domain-containing protein, partial [Aurantibacter sp.]
VEGTFGEDASLAADMTREVVLGFQGEKLGAASVALTTKHFPGGGATEGGQDPHFKWGKREVFPGGMFENNLIPFKAAIEAGTSAIMPYYSFPVNTKYDEVAYAYNHGILQDLLRGELGFKGIINSDTGPIEMMPWGVEELSITERYKLALEAGVNIFSGTADPTQLLETLKLYPELMPKVDESVHLLLLEKFRLGLFENPYVDVEAATNIIGNPKFKERADLAMRKSIVLLRNEEVGGSKILPIQPKTKVYFETYLPKKDASSSNVYQSLPSDHDIEIVGSPQRADVILLWLIPKGKSLFESDGSPLHVNLSENNIDPDYINGLATKKPTVLVVNYTNPWAIDEIYDPADTNIKGILATFGTTPEAILDVVTGRFAPSGKMPFSTPISDDAAQNQKSDVPGYQEEGNYALFKFDEGMEGY